MAIPFHGGFGNQVECSQSMLKIPRQQGKLSVGNKVEYRILKEFFQAVIEGFYFNQFIIVLKNCCLNFVCEKNSVWFVTIDVSFTKMLNKFYSKYYLS